MKTPVFVRFSTVVGSRGPADRVRDVRGFATKFYTAFSYLDTQLIRLSGPNFAQIPINRPVSPVHNNQRDGYMRQTINESRASYYPNSLGKGCPMLAPESAQGYIHYAEKIEGRATRARSESFKDFFSQATLFWIAKGLGLIKGAKGQEVPVDASAITASSVMYDAVFIPGGQESVSQLLRPGRARHFVAEAFKHGKPIGAVGEGVEFLVRSDLPGLPSAGALSNGGLSNSNGVVTMRNMPEMNSFIQQFTAAIAKRRHWSRLREQAPA